MYPYVSCLGISFLWGYSFPCNEWFLWRKRQQLQTGNFLSQQYYEISITKFEGFSPYDYIVFWHLKILWDIF